MRSWIYLACLLAIIIKTSHAATSSHGYCTKEEQGTLDSRVRHADVVITGTVIRIDTESYIEDSVENREEEQSSNMTEVQSGRQKVGLVKLWRVVKGSLAQVANCSSRPEGLLSDESDHSILMSNPTIKLYGLWNDLLCGSFVTVGDTRIFFLKKFQDFRDIAEMKLVTVKSETNTSIAAPLPVSPKSTRVLAPSDLREANVTAMTDDSDSDSSSRQMKNKKDRAKKKKKGSKKNKTPKPGKKGRKRKKSKKNGKTEGRSRRRKARRKKRKTSESMYSVLKKMRSKRSSKHASHTPRLTESNSRARRDAENPAPRSVLVLNSPPARITLANLNEVEELASAT